MPSCNLHVEVAEHTWRSLCSLEDRHGLVFCELDLNSLLNHVCEPDMKPDLVQRVVEYCVCRIDQDVVEVDVEKCKEILSHVEEYEKVSRCEVRRDKRSLGYARHHANGVNSVLWRYYLLLAARRYHAGNTREATRYLARAVHYAQDGVVPRHIKVKGTLGEISMRVDELHDIVEEYLDVNRDVLRSKLNEVYHMYLELSREKPFRFKKIEAREQLDVAWDLLRATVYTFAKFSEIVKWARREERRVRKTIGILKALKYAGVTLVVVAVGLIAWRIHFNTSVNAEVITSLVAPAIPLMSLQGIYMDLKTPQLFVLGLTKNTSKLLVTRKRNRTKTTVEKYIPMESS